MIDLHTHLLPGIDDGSPSLEDTIQLLKKAESVGITDLMFTSHYAKFRHYLASKDTTQTLFDQVKEKAAEEGISIRLYLGNEIDYDDELLHYLEEDKVRTLGDSKYVLLDFGFKEYEIDDVIYELVVRGYKPIIAHPERYRYIQGVEEFKKWRKTGALLQVNASSLFGKHHEKRQVKLMLKHQLIDLVSSDVHKSTQTYDDFLKTKEYMEKKCDQAFVKRVFETNPLKIIK
ncbi:MAG: tyrosine-protein phosphatase [Candidatus Izemoplasmataceae bacterium]